MDGKVAKNTRIHQEAIQRAAPHISHLRDKINVFVQYITDLNPG